VDSSPPQDQDVTTGTVTNEVQTGAAEAVTLVEDVSVDGMCGVY
jgi:mycofactocin precursor